MGSKRRMPALFTRPHNPAIQGNKKTYTREKKHVSNNNTKNQQPQVDKQQCQYD